MNRFFAGLFFVFLGLLCVAAWMLAAEDYRTEIAQDKFYEIAQKRVEIIDKKQVDKTSDATEDVALSEPSEPSVTTAFSEEVTTEQVAETTEATTVATTEATTEETTVATTEEKVEEETVEGIVLLFGGDLNLDKNYSTVSGTQSIDEALLSEMKNADVFMHGNLFAFTDGGNAADKAYVFRADTKDAEILSSVGTDVVSLANNHSFDYGTEGLASTVSALEAKNIACVGAGENETAAEKPYYVTVKGKKIAFTAAMRSEKYLKTPEAKGDEAGVVKMYDLENYLDVIREAKANADVVVAYAHWGVENTIWIEQEQIDGARAMIDAGADIVVGAHSHLLQTAIVYNGKPIFYGLGDLHGEGGLAKIVIGEDGEITSFVIPFANEGGVVTPLSGDAYNKKIGEMNFVSSTDTVLANGKLTK